MLVPHVRIVCADDATAAAYDTMCRDLHRAHFQDDESYVFKWRDQVAGKPGPSLVLRRGDNRMTRVLLSWPAFLLSWLTCTSSLYIIAFLRMVPERQFYITKEISIAQAASF